MRYVHVREAFLEQNPLWRLKSCGVKRRKSRKRRRRSINRCRLELSRKTRCFRWAVCQTSRGCARMGQVRKNDAVFVITRVFYRVKTNPPLVVKTSDSGCGRSQKLRLNRH